MLKKQAKQVVYYNPTLVHDLKSQHKILMYKYKDMLGFIEQQQYVELNASLKEFSVLITDHFKRERELYMYLEYVVSKNDGTYRSVRTEMKDIAVSIRAIINSHINIPIADHSIEKFRKDISLLGKELLGRMRHEEVHLFKDYTDHGQSVVE